MSHLRLFPLLLLAAVGCSGQSAVVTGKVTADGKVVTGGSLTLSPKAEDGNPLPGPPGQADIRPDGAFSLTIEAGEAGLAQKYDVRFSPPIMQFTSKSKDFTTPYQGLTPKQAVVEIKPGNNVIDIELVPGG